MVYNRQPNDVLINTRTFDHLFHRDKDGKNLAKFNDIDYAISLGEYLEEIAKDGLEYGIYEQKDFEGNLVNVKVCDLDRDYCNWSKHAYNRYMKGEKREVLAKEFSKLLVP